MSYLEETSQSVDPVRPGEQWFLYWKTSASLWESKIVQFAADEIIFIPLNWGFHFDPTAQWDFGKYHPEKDLGRLTQLLTQHGRKFCWLLPLTPAPFLPNGGVPVPAAKVLSVSKDGVHLATLDQEKKIHKMFSFFEPKVFQSFVQFLQAFKKFLLETRGQSPIWGGSFYFNQSRTQVSYFEDHSFAFEQAFSRYLKQSFPQGVDLKLTAEEEKLKASFTLEASQLFISTAAEIYGPLWQGNQKISFLGGSPKELIERGVASGRSQSQYFDDLFLNYVNERVVSSSLLMPSEKKDLLPKVLAEHFGSECLHHRYRYHAYEGGLGDKFRPLNLIDIFDSDNTYFTEVGLIPFLDKKFRWMYNISAHVEFNTDWIESHHDRVKFFRGKNLDRTEFSNMLKLFMMGQQVVLDKAGLSDEFEKKLNVFFLENNLNLQSINFVTLVSICELGEGRLVVYEGEKLSARPDNFSFWEQIFKYFNLTQPDLRADDDVYSLWRVRATSSFELNYLDVRRVNLYNPTSYKKMVTISTQKHFAFMKIIDPLLAQAKSHPQGVEIELLPNGKIALDFGHYEESR